MLKRGLKMKKINAKKVSSGSFASALFTAKVIDIEAGQNEIVLSEDEARRMDLMLLDRVKVKCRGRAATAMVNYSRYYVKPGTVELLGEVTRKLGAETGDAVTLEPTHRPKSLDYIRKKLERQTLSESEINEIIVD